MSEEEKAKKKKRDKVKTDIRYGQGGKELANGGRNSSSAKSLRKGTSLALSKMLAKNLRSISR